MPVIARKDRAGEDGMSAGVTDGTAREVSVPLNF